MPLLTTQMGGLSCRVFQQSAGAPKLACVLCHGFGAPGEDLVGLGAALVALRPELQDVRFVFPAAPLSLGAMGAGWGDARAWWMLDLDRILSLQTKAGNTAEAAARLRAEIPEGLAPARRHLMGLVNELARTSGLSLSRIALGGFSQGAMLATDVSLRLEEPPAALAILSGTLIAEPEWTARASARSGLAVFQSHGRHDPLLPFDNAERLRDLLLRAGLKVDFLAFDGEHTIPPDALEGLGRLLAANVV
jgi:phospholipase/carboxylesterase